MKTRKTIAMVLAAALGLVFSLGAPARQAAADSVTFANGDMAVLDQGGSGKHLYHVKADGSAKTLMGTYTAINLWAVTFDAQGKVVVADDNNVYRVDPGSFTPSSSGTALNISGMAPVNVGYDGVEVGSAGTIYIDAYNNGQNGYFRLTNTGGDNYAATRVGPAGGIGWNWQLAVETDAPGAAQLLGFSGSTSNMYRFSEAGGTQTKLNNTAIVSPAYSIGYDPTANVAYAGSYSSSLISKVDLATGATTQNWINMGSPVRDMDFYGNMLYAVKTTSNGGIFTIDPATAVATQVGSVAFDSPRGIAVFGSGSPEGDIPEPATMLAVLAGIAGLGGYVRKRRSTKQTVRHSVTRLEMKTRKTIAVLLAVAMFLGLAGAAQAALVVDDPVEPGSGWITAGFGNGYGLTTPIEGANLINMAGYDVEPASKDFTGVLLEAGTYNSTFWVHNYSNNASPAPGVNSHLQANAVNIDDLLTSSNTPSPARGQWVQWSLTHVVPSGDARIGDTLGFFITDIAGGGNGAFDSLDIDFTAAAGGPGDGDVPEPATMAMLGLAVAGLGGYVRRRRKLA